MSEKRRAPARPPGRWELLWISTVGGFVGTLAAVVLVALFAWMMLEWFM